MRIEDEAKLIEKAKLGNGEAVSQLYEMHVQAIYQYIHYRVGDTALAEDLTSETFLRAVEGLANYENRGVPFRAWLYRIAKGRVVDQYRKDKRRNLQGLDGFDRADDVDVEREVTHLLDVDSVSALLVQLTDQQQDVIVMRFLIGYSIQETASMMDKTSGSVKALQHRALSSLARIYENEYGKRE